MMCPFLSEDLDNTGVVLYDVEINANKLIAGFNNPLMTLSHHQLKFTSEKH